MKQIKALILALTLLAPQPAKADSWYNNILNWLTEQKNTALCLVGIGAACAVVYGINRGATSGRNIIIKKGPITIGNTTYPDGWERTDLLATHNVILKQPEVPQQSGVQCGFCALRDSHNVRLNLEGKPSVSYDAWSNLFAEQKEFIVSRREANNRKIQSSIGVKEQLIEKMKKANPNDPLIKDEENALNNLKMNIDQNPNRDTTNGGEIEALLDKSPDYYGFAAGDRGQFYMTLDDFEIINTGLLDVDYAKKTIWSGGIYTFFLGSMKQGSVNYPVGFGHWISFTVRKLPTGEYEGIATDSLNGNRLDDERIIKLIELLDAVPTQSETMWQRLQRYKVGE